MGHVKIKNFVRTGLGLVLGLFMLNCYTQGDSLYF